MTANSVKIFLIWPEKVKFHLHCFNFLVWSQYYCYSIRSCGDWREKESNFVSGCPYYIRGVETRYKSDTMFLPLPLPSSPHFFFKVLFSSWKQNVSGSQDVKGYSLKPKWLFCLLVGSANLPLPPPLFPTIRTSPKTCPLALLTSPKTYSTVLCTSKSYLHCLIHS